MVFDKAAYYKEYYKKNKEKYQQRYRKNQDKRLVQNQHLKARFGISVEDYDRMVGEQNGSCWICQESCGTGRALAVDHCHTTGKIRGLLCLSCNVGLGNFKDNKELLEKAIKYLDEYEENS